MDPERVKSEALELPITDRLELAQALIKSFYPQAQAQAKPKVIDSEKPLNEDSDFQIEPDPVITVEPVTQAPRRIVIEGTEAQALPNPAKPELQSEGANSINEAFQKLRGALEAETGT